MDGHKLPWHYDRLQAWLRGERIAPVLVDMALTQACQLNCSFCYAKLQRNEGHKITRPIIYAFLEDCAKMGVGAVSFLSDGESTLSPVFCHTIERATELGIATALGTNAVHYTEEMRERTLPHLRYIRINCPAGTPEDYAEVTGTSAKVFDRVCHNVAEMVKLKRKGELNVHLSLQLVLMPQNSHHLIPFVVLAKELGVDAAIIKHCADDENSTLGISYAQYKDLTPLLKAAESLAGPGFDVQVMWSKMMHGDKRTYQRCYGPPFLLQISGSGLVATCGDKFAPQYERFQLGNICTERFYDIWQSERYGQVMDYLAKEFNAQTECGPLCRHHKVNEALDNHLKGIAEVEEATTWTPNSEFL